MNRRFLIIGGIIGILIISVAIVLFSQDNAGNKGNLGLVPTAAVSPVISKGQTYQEFLSSGKSEMCTFTLDSGGKSTNGTVYAANGKIRADFTIPLENGTFQQHMLVDSYVVYLWTNVNSAGIKFFAKDKTPNDTFKSLTNYDCTPWTTNLSVFDLPASVIFTEITQYSEDNILRNVGIDPSTVPTIPQEGQ